MHTSPSVDDAHLRVRSDNQHSRVATVLRRLLTVAALSVVIWGASEALSPEPAAAHDCAPGDVHDGGPNGGQNSYGHLWCWNYGPTPVDPPDDPPDDTSDDPDPEGLILWSARTEQPAARLRRRRARAHLQQSKRLVPFRSHRSEQRLPNTSC